MLVFGSHRENLASRRVAVEPPQPLASLIIAPTPPIQGKMIPVLFLYRLRDWCFYRGMKCLSILMALTIYLTLFTPTYEFLLKLDS